MDAAHCSVTSTLLPAGEAEALTSLSGEASADAWGLPHPERQLRHSRHPGCQITVYRFMRKHERVNRYTVIFDSKLTFNRFYGIVVLSRKMLVWARVNS